MHSESLRLGRTIDVENTPYDGYIGKLALDILLHEQDITEAQFLHVLYSLEDMETVNDLQSVYSTEMRNNNDQMRSHPRLITEGVSGGVGSGKLRSRPASGLNASRSGSDPFLPHPPS